MLPLLFIRRQRRHSFVQHKAVVALQPPPCQRICHHLIIQSSNQSTNNNNNNNNNKNRYLDRQPQYPEQQSQQHQIIVDPTDRRTIYQYHRIRQRNQVQQQPFFSSLSSLFFSTATTTSSETIQTTSTKRSTSTTELNSIKKKLDSNDDSTSKVHTNHQAVVKEPITTTTTTTTTTKRTNECKKLKIYDMNELNINSIYDIETLAMLCDEVEQIPILTTVHMKQFVECLMKRCSDVLFELQGAILAERILFHCLSRIPRQYHNNDTNNNKDDNILLLNEQQHQRQNLPYPTIEMYHYGILAWGSIGHKKAAERADKIFHLLVDEHYREYEYVQKRKEMMKNISFLKKMKDDTNEEDKIKEEQNLYNKCYSAAPSHESYKYLIRAWSKCNDVIGQKKSVQYLEEFENVTGVYEQINHWYSQQTTPEYKDRKMVHHHHPSSQKQINHPSSGDKIMQMMTELQMDPPDDFSYNAVLSTLSKLYHEKNSRTIHHCNTIINRMDILHKITGSNRFILKAYTYHSWLRAYSKYVNLLTPGLSETTKLDVSVIKEIIVILRRIHAQQKLYEGQIKNNPPDVTIYVEPPSKDDSMGVKYPKLIPVLSMHWAYGVLINALVRTDPLDNAVLLANNILLSMTGNIPNPIQSDFDFLSLPPSVATTSEHYNVEHNISGFSSGSITMHSNYVVPKGIRAPKKNWPHPDTIQLVVKAWEKSNVPDVDTKIQQLLYATVVMAPTFDSISSIHKSMEEWEILNSKHSPELVESILVRTIQNYNQYQTTKPTRQTFIIPIRTWLKSRREDAPRRMELIFQRMVDLYIAFHDEWYRPNGTHVHTILTAWIDKCYTGQKYFGMNNNNNNNNTTTTEEKKMLYPAEHCEEFILRHKDSDWFKPIAMDAFCDTLRAWSSQILPTNMNDKNNTNINDDVPNPIERCTVLFNHLEAMMEQTTDSESSIFDGNDIIDINDDFDKIPAYPCNWILEVCKRSQSTKEKKLKSYQLALKAFQASKRNARTYVLMVQVMKEQLLFSENESNLQQQMPSSLLLSGQPMSPKTTSTTEVEEQQQQQQQQQSSSSHSLMMMDKIHEKMIEDLFVECCSAGLVSKDLVYEVISISTRERLQELLGLSRDSIEKLQQECRTDRSSSEEDDEDENDHDHDETTTVSKQGIDPVVQQKFDMTLLDDIDSLFAMPSPGGGGQQQQQHKLGVGIVIHGASQTLPPAMPYILQHLPKSWSMNNAKYSKKTKQQYERTKEHKKFIRKILE